MEILEHRYPLHLPLARDYVESFSTVSDFFDFDPNVPDHYIQRLQTLKLTQLKCDRTKLVEVLKVYNVEVGNHIKALEQIDRLQDPNSVVVIGGQQPGIFTGPLYTIHKIMTILTISQREEARLGVPVIPVFWIAGEDHDWDEVNHVYALSPNHTLQKMTLPRHVQKRTSISHIPYIPQEVEQLLDRYFAFLPRTEYTADLRHQIHEAIYASSSYSHFFARLLVSLFGEEGLVLVDSADERLRAIEGDMFAQIISQNEEIAHDLQLRSEEVLRRGYTPQVESKIENANLFMYIDGERHAVKRHGEGFRLRHQNIVFSKDELIKKAHEEPQMFSCNVVTRPLMQEYLFPVLAFVGGPGEISYWALYRNIFHRLGMQMPIIVPRITITLMERHVQKLAEMYDLTFEQLIYELDRYKTLWLQNQDDYEVFPQFQKVKEEIAKLYAPLQQKLALIDPTLVKLSEKNLHILQDQVHYLERKTKQHMELKHDVVMKQFDRTKISILPNGHPQERVHNIFAFLNQYGYDWWNAFKRLKFDVNGLHKEVRI